ncbi:HAD-IA family hydrolase [Jannaschia aquimarina]|uniref:phosphoglycolate phosphatase n=1 Tax=Jannaschia aquimarina TaxID=935700 RepID=A0A0D1D9D0_9RHOB|nr:HAD-IA family hydrolase [Jannaschia aquimarina]KIT16503.1 Phosphoglycolate phosphatase [Jannaschia aquimarina]SNT07018.1 phosphoglycolate phosphatase [Jannaschia aquimarina]
MSLTPRAIIFDLDGTLIDSLPVILRAFHSVCAALDLPKPDLRTAQGFVGAGVPVAMTRLLAWANADPSLHGRAVEEMEAAYGASPGDNEVYPGVREMLARLQEMGLPLGLCTNKPEAPTRAVLDALELGPFGAVVCGDTLKLRKPHPDPLLETARRLGVAASDTLYVGDSEIDHQTAAAAGIPFAFFEGGYLNAPLGDPPPALVLSAMSDLPQAFTSEMVRKA